MHLELSGADLRRVRLLPFADPIEEMIIGAHRLPLLAADPLLGGWARHTVSSLGPAGVPLLEVMNSPFVQVSDLTQTPPTAGRSFEAALDNILSAPVEKWRSEVEYLGSLGIPAGPARGLADGDEAAIANFGGALRRFHDVALRPYWTAITTYTAGGRDSLMRLLAARGIDALLNSLLPAPERQLAAPGADHGPADGLPARLCSSDDQPVDRTHRHLRGERSRSVVATVRVRLDPHLPGT